jgi:uncharacterized protein YeaO (DUF488 family)
MPVSSGRGFAPSLARDDVYHLFPPPALAEEPAVSIAVLRLGSPRTPDEGLRLGTVRRPPRGIPKEKFAQLDFYDVWLPVLSPSQALVTMAQRSKDQRTWQAFSRRFRAEMRRPDAARILDLLAALSHQTNLSVGCYCEGEQRCHRSILRDLLAERGARLAGSRSDSATAAGQQPLAVRD